MRKAIYAASVLAALAISAVASAQASSNALDVTPSGISIRAGGAFPIDSSFSNDQSVLIDLGVEYQLVQSFLPKGETYFSLDYQVKGFSGDRGTVWPFCINERFYKGGRAVGNRPYVFAGIGVAFVSFSSTDTVLAGRVGAGAELGENIFFETALTIAEKVQDVRPNSIAVSIGYRF